MPRRVKPYTLFKGLVVRDTLPHNGEDFLQLDRAIAWGFRVMNGCNQAVTIDLTDGPGGGLIGASAVIAANTVEPIATDLWAPAVGVRATYAVAPTTGSLSLTGWVQEEV